MDKKVKGKDVERTSFDRILKEGNLNNKQNGDLSNDAKVRILDVWNTP